MKWRSRSCKKTKNTWENVTRSMLRYAAFFVKHALYSSLPRKTRQDSKDWRNDSSFQRKRSSVTAAGRTREDLIVRNAKCFSAPPNEESISALNAGSIPAVI